MRKSYVHEKDLQAEGIYNFQDKTTKKYVTVHPQVEELQATNNPLVTLKTMLASPGEEQTVERGGAKTATGQYNTIDTDKAKDSFDAEAVRMNVLNSEYNNLDEIVRLQEYYNQNRATTVNTGGPLNERSRIANQFRGRNSNEFKKVVGSQDTFQTTRSVMSRHSKAYVEQN